ncbi:hypothetical protein Psi02_33450 [Planotetraspora silvatica]|uniref:Uncharacterized protein n=1 Tax=Planotetraspora silvatica TaxID=234614 RepID=A0A8J3UP82_9ACTN|nr:hypothetical protein Psi02_33450 [Planotetraspora silvatica]
MGRPADMVEDLAGLDEEGGAGRSELDVVGAAIQQSHPEFPFETLHLLTQGGLHDVLAKGCPAEVQFLSQGHEIPELA